MKGEEHFLTDRRPENIFCVTSQFCLNEDDSSAMSDARATSMSSNVSSPPELVCAKNVYRNMWSTVPLMASCHAWAIIPGRRLLRHHASSPNMRP
jgi:hypothetical protein